MRKYNEFLKERLTGTHPSNKTMPELDAKDTARPPPFDNETLEGWVDYISIKRSLRTFGGICLEDHSQDDGTPPMVGL